METLINNLQGALADELLAMQQYFFEARIIEQSNSRQSIIKELKQHAIEEYKHAGWLADRILEMGGTLITKPNTLYTKSGCGYSETNTSNTITILDDAIKGEQCAINSYSKMAKIAKESNDIKTYDVLMKIIKDEVNHKNDLQELKQNFK